MIIKEIVEQYDAAIAALAAAKKLPADQIWPAPKKEDSKDHKVWSAERALRAAADALEGALDWLESGQIANDPAGMEELQQQYDCYWSGASQIRATGARVFKQAIRIEQSNSIHIDADPARNDPRAWGGLSSKDTASRASKVWLAAVR
jgi:hypothetical protein